MTSTDSRLRQLDKWLRQCFPDQSIELETASSDASFRRYFRVTVAGQSYIAMDAPPQHENLTAFIQVAEGLRKAAGVHTPEIFFRDETQGFLLLSDFGQQSFLDALTTDNADKLYKQAIDTLIDIQTISPDSLPLPDYDQNLLMREMRLFDEWFLKRHLQIDCPQWLPDLYQWLTDSVMQQPQRLVHRDYHSRNLMVRPEEPLGVIDFQDAVYGPATYDLVSLLKDAYISWPEQRIKGWFDYYASNAVSAGVIHQADTDTLFRDFDLMGLQRHLKILGIFCRLNYRDNKPRYLDDLRRVLDYVYPVTARYSELAELDHFLRKTDVIRDLK